MEYINKALIGLSAIRFSVGGHRYSICRQDPGGPARGFFTGVH